METFNSSCPEGTNTTTHNATSEISGDPITVNIKIGMTSAYVVIFTFGLFSNAVGLSVVCKKTNSRSVANILISNLAVADLLLTLSIVPYSVEYLYIRNLWFGGIFGYFTCTALFFVFNVSVAASVLTILVVSIGKFYAVFYPLRGRLFKRAKLMSAFVWIASMVLMSPNLLFYRNFRERNQRYYCVQMWFWEDDTVHFTKSYHVLRIYHAIAFVCFYAAPLSIIAVLHILIALRLWLRKVPGNSSTRSREARSRQNRKALKLLSVIVIAFALFWSPAYVMHYYMYFAAEEWARLPIQVPIISFWIAHTHSSINPCLYILLNGKFRKDFTSALNIRSFFARQAHPAQTRRESIASTNLARSILSIASLGRYSSHDLPCSAGAARSSSNYTTSGASLRKVTNWTTTL